MKLLLISGGWVLCSASLIFAATTPDLVKDGGFEQSQRVQLHEAQWIERAIKREGVEFTRAGDDVIIPVNIANFCGTKVLKVIEGSPGDKVHSGKQSILLNGSFYVRQAAEGNYNTREGDILQVEFYAKGTGEVGVAITPSGDGKLDVRNMSQKETPADNGWRKIEQTMICLGAVQTIEPRLCTTNAVYIDDLSIRRVLRSNEASVEGQRAASTELAKVAFACPLKAAPALDGKLDDECWKDVPETSGFLAYGNQAMLAEPLTTVKVGYDDNALYLGVTCPEPNLSSFIPLLDKFPDLSKEKWVGPTTMEFFLDPGRSLLTYYQFAVSARGHKYEGLRKEGDWNAPWEAKGAIGENSYTQEIRIPFSSLGVPKPAIGDVWGFNVCRNRDVTHSAWNPVGSDFHNPAGFGQLVFGSFADWYREIFERKTNALRAQIEKKIETTASDPELKARLDLLGRYTSEVKQVIEKSGSPKDWRECGKLYGQGNFAVDSYRRIDSCLEWISLPEGKK